MKRGFTLIELMVVVGIMGILGTVTVGGYKAMRTGMENKGVLQNANAFVRAAYQRAQVDRQPTAIFMWNETSRASDADNNEIVAGRAVAVRRAGRITKAKWPYLYDEFADLNLAYLVNDDEEESGSSTASTMYLYPMDNLQDSSSQLKRSVVEGKVYPQKVTLTYLSGDTSLKDLDSGNLETYVFKGKDQGGVTWENGMAYGFEFARLDLPNGFIFGSNYKRSLSDPIQDAGIRVFDITKNSGTGMESGGSFQSISIYALRPGTDGSLQAKEIGQATDPSKDMNN